METNRKHPVSFAVLAALLAAGMSLCPAVIAAADSEPAERAVDSAATPPELIQSQARQLAQTIGEVDRKTVGVDWRGAYSPKFGIVEGRTFQQTLDRINQLAAECDRQIALRETYGERASDQDASACRASLREIHNQVFLLRVNATRVWSPASGGYQSYLVDVEGLERLTGKLVRLAEACAKPAGKACGCEVAASGSESRKIASANTSLIW